MQEETGGAWRPIVTRVLMSIAHDGAVGERDWCALHDAHRAVLQADAAAAEIAMFRRVAVAVHRLDFSLLHAAPVDLLRARQELLAATQAWTAFCAATAIDGRRGFKSQMPLPVSLAA